MNSEDINELSSSLVKCNLNEDSPFEFSQKVFKKSSSNQLLVLYLGSREIVVNQNRPPKISGVVYIDPKIIDMAQKVYIQFSLIFRYGREDEEVMGLKFCNEVVLALNQIWNKDEIKLEKERNLSSLQHALIERLGETNSFPFTIEIDKEIPASVQLLPAKRYNGSPIGTSYDLRVYAVLSQDLEEKIQKRYSVRLGVRLTHSFNADWEELIKKNISDSKTTSLPRLRMKKLLSPKARKLIKQTSLIIQRANNSLKCQQHETECPETKTSKGPSIQMEKKTHMWTEGRINLKGSLNKTSFVHGEPVSVILELTNESRKVVRKIRISLYQYVDVCMFSNGKFKNVVAETEINEIISPTQSFYGTYSLTPVRGQTKNWIAVEGSLFSSSHHHDSSLNALSSKLASSTPLNTIYFTTTKQTQSKYSFYDQKRHPVRHHTISSHHVADNDEQEEKESTSVCSGGGGNYTEKNVFAIQVSYYAKIKLFLSSIGGGDISLKLPFFLGNVEQSNEKNDTPDQRENFTSDTHETAKNQAQSYATNELTAILNENTNDFNQSLHSSASDLELNSEYKRESVIQAQIHERKYLESDM